MSFLGREICRPKPLCEECLMKGVCMYYAKVVRATKKGPAKQQKMATTTATTTKPKKAAKPRTAAKRKNKKPT
jgi:adenine-specific DNA glycosylase